MKKCKGCSTKKQMNVPSTFQFQNFLNRGVTMTENASCYGCMVEGYCDFEREAKRKGCPCMICLVKGMCQKPCEDYNQFLGEIHKE